MLVLERERRERIVRHLIGHNVNKSVQVVGKRVVCVFLSKWTAKGHKIDVLNV